ncbi:phospholipase D/nuclease [Rhizodiscina lignyota]|uniref:Phospholipase D/nuclease n=1 Tax=Rhizodiscina lignyota TaxID=1504668 RepID=A0A9P4I4V5_9PEZI|nr:phospholipase D/nuclease [Rhizodiscina lignyota]
MATRISDKLYDLCRGDSSVLGELSKDPSLTPEKAIHALFGHNKPKLLDQQPPKERTPASEEDLERAYQCGRFGDTRPSELFLRIYHDALTTLEHDLFMGCVSPPLMGSSGVVPLTIIGDLHDICRHMSNLIARAEKEVCLATNFWMKSRASTLITDALKELSKRAGERGERAVVKIIYDRGNLKQFVDPHQAVPESAYTGKSVELPSKEEIPNIDLQVVNYHRPMLGTFHSKFMIVDRAYGIVSSNNIQDNDNLEMMVHVEGPIVDSLYDTFILSWHSPLEPTLPCLSPSTKLKTLPTFEQESFKNLFDENGILKEEHAASIQLPEHLQGDPHYDPDIASEVTRVRSTMQPRDGETVSDVVARHLNQTTGQDRKPTAPPCDPSDTFMPILPHAPHKPFPIALVNRKPWGAPNHNCCFTPQSEAWLSAIRYAKSEIFMQTPDLNAEPLLPEILDAARRGVKVTYYVCLGYNDAGELLPHQGGHNEMVAAKLYEKLDDEHKQYLNVHYYVGKDQDRPIHNKFKARSCHIKIMVIDGHVGIAGNGNLDTQSFYHSQEVNIMIDSPTICAAWLEGIRRNENTHLYGKGSQEDGVWRDENGNEADGAIGKDPGHFAWAKGVVGAIQRVRGAGGF